MITHVVLMQPRLHLSGDERRAFVESFTRAVQGIPTVRGVRVGRRVLHGAGYEAGTPAGTGSYVAIIDFDDLAGLRTYLGHPAHAEVGRRLAEVMQAVSVYDFEGGGLELLPRLADDG